MTLARRDSGKRSVRLFIFFVVVVVVDREEPDIWLVRSQKPFTIFSLQNNV